MIPWNHQQNSEINGEFPTMETPNYGNDYSVSLPQTLVSNGYPPKMSTDASQFYGYTDSFASFPSPPFPLTEFQSDTYCRTSSFQPASNPSAPTASYQSLNNRQYYCQICRISVSGPEPFNQHIAGKKHQFKISATQENSQFSWDCFNSSNRSGLCFLVPIARRTSLSTCVIRIIYSLTEYHYNMIDFMMQSSRQSHTTRERIRDYSSPSNFWLNSGRTHSSRSNSSTARLANFNCQV